MVPVAVTVRSFDLNNLLLADVTVVCTSLFSCTLRDNDNVRFTVCT